MSEGAGWTIDPHLGVGRASRREEIASGDTQPFLCREPTDPDGRPAGRSRAGERGRHAQVHRGTIDDVDLVHEARLAPESARIGSIDRQHERSGVRPDDNGAALALRAETAREPTPVFALEVVVLERPEGRYEGRRNERGRDEP